MPDDLDRSWYLWNVCKEHAEKFETEIVFDHIDEVDFSESAPTALKVIALSQYSCDALDYLYRCVCAKYLGLESEDCVYG